MRQSGRDIEKARVRTVKAPLRPQRRRRPHEHGKQLFGHALAHGTKKRSRAGQQAQHLLFQSLRFYFKLYVLLILPPIRAFGKYADARLAGCRTLLSRSFTPGRRPDHVLRQSVRSRVRAGPRAPLRPEEGRASAVPEMSPCRTDHANQTEQVPVRQRRQGSCQD